MAGDAAQVVESAHLARMKISVQSPALNKPGAAPSCQHSGLTGTVSSEVSYPLWGSPGPTDSGDQGTTKADSPPSI
mgnify:CR=1 FL=1